MNYNDLIRSVAGSAGLTRKQADNAVVTALTVMSEVISADETRDLLAQLPKSFRERVPVSGETMPMRPIEFVARVADLSSVPLEDAERNVRSVFGVLAQAVNRGEIADVADELGEQYDEWLGRTRERPPPDPVAEATTEPVGEKAEAPFAPPTVPPPVPQPMPGRGAAHEGSRIGAVGGAVVGAAERVATWAVWPLRMGVRLIGRRQLLQR